MIERKVKVQLADIQPDPSSISFNSEATALTSKPLPLIVKLCSQVCAVLFSSFLPEAGVIQEWFSPSPLTSSELSTAKIKPFLRTNARGLEIIKRFEKFPPDVEPNVREAERIVRRFVTVPLTSNQFSALVSFTYNIGQTTFQESRLLKYLNAGRYKAAAKEFDAWIYIGTRRLPELMARRVAERGLFLQ